MKHLPNFLTLLRVGLIPVFAACFIFGWYDFAALAFAVAALSDVLDGYLARLLQVESELGAFLDPVADKLLVSTALVLLIQRDPTLWVALPAAVIIGREITVSALRAWSAGQGVSYIISVSWIGKVKTISQMTAILILVYQDWYPWLGMAMLYLATLLTLGSMIHYLIKVWPSLTRT